MINVANPKAFKDSFFTFASSFFSSLPPRLLLLFSIFLLFTFLSSPLFSKSLPKQNLDSFNINIKNIIGDKKYNKNQNLIKFLFKKQNSFYTLDYINYAKTYKFLYDNSLLNKKSKKVKLLNINFILNSKYPFKDFKVLKDVLTKIGYLSFSTKAFKYNKQNTSLKWNINIKSKKPFDVISFSKALRQNGAKLKHIQNLNNNYGDKLANQSNIQSNSFSTKYYSNFMYKLDFTKSYVDKALFVPNYEETKLPFLFEPILIQIKNTKTIKLSYFNTWYAHIIYYDKNLKQLGFNKSLKQRYVFLL